MADFEARLVKCIAQVHWNNNYPNWVAALEAFMQDFPDGPQAHGSRNSYEYTLWLFVSLQRELYSCGQLPATNIAVFEDRIPGWSWDPQSDADLRYLMNFFL